MSRMPLLDGVLRLRFLLLGVMALLMYVGGASQLDGLPNDWEYFTWGSDALLGRPGILVRGGQPFTAGGDVGLHLYAEFPFLQIGPPALLAAAVLQLGPQDGLYVAQVVIQLLCLLSIYLVDRAFRDCGRHVPLAVLLGGSLVTAVWSSLTHITHLDDAITLTCLSAAVLALRRDRWVLLGTLLGLGAASKPWGVVAACLVLAASGWKLRLRAAAAAAGVILLVWTPFVAADVDTLRLGGFHLPAAAGSPLAAIGLGGLAGETWFRSLQLLISVGVGATVVLRGHWGLAALAAFTTRLMLDPAAYQYYATSAVFAALVADLAVVRARIPILTCVAATGWVTVRFVDTEGAAGVARAACYLLLLLMVLLLCVVQRRAHRSRAWAPRLWARRAGSSSWRTSASAK